MEVVTQRLVTAARVGIVLAGALSVWAATGHAQATPPMTWDQSRAVETRRIKPPVPPTNIDWDRRITDLF